MSDDLMYQDRIRETVGSAYRAIPQGAGRRMAERFYSDAELDRLPEEAITWALGVGNPVRPAELQPGQTVLDLGNGGGIDAILAAHEVGPDGHVIGVDMLPEMQERAERAAGVAGVSERCEFVVGQLEDLPLPDSSIDVAISNGVINLSPRKSRALAEVARVLRPGGRLCVTDLTVDDDLPPEVLTSEAAWAGCIAGAVSERVLVTKLGNVGMIDVITSDHTPFGVDDVALYPLFTAEVIELMRRLIPQPAQDRVAVGLVVRATKPTS